MLINRKTALGRLPSLMPFALGVSLIASPALSQSATQQTSSSDEALSSLPGNAFAGKRRRNVVATQVMLDRAGFSPGVIDGLSGGNTARAIGDWQQSHGVSRTGQVDSALINRLQSTTGGPIITQYKLTEADVEGQFGPLPAGMEALSEVDSAHYETVTEALAEKFHMTPDLLQALNPGMDLSIVGSTIAVPAVEEVQIVGEVARIEINGGESSVRAFSADGKLLASYPATVGSNEFPSPTGSMKVRAVAPNPVYYFSPEGRNWGPDKKLTIAAGPNNPVGSTWIDLTKEGYGIHGTPDPSLIGKTSSHGCVRLTNWDAQSLSKAVTTSTVVEFV